MRILLCNNRYFLSGGPERYLFRTERTLRDMGHEVIPLALAYAANQDSPHAASFIPPPVGPDHVMYGDRPLSLREKGRLFLASLYHPPARRAVQRVIDEKSIDLVYTLQIGNLLSPALIDGVHRTGRPIISRLSDFQLLCPSYHFMRDSRPCEDCRTTLLNAVRHRCLQGSYLVSAARVLGMYVEKILGTSDKIDHFITTTDFMRDKLVEAGFSPSRITTLRTPVETPSATPGGGDYVLYAGSLAEHKGVDVLAAAMRSLPGIPLRIAGPWSASAEKRFREKLTAAKVENIELVGFVTDEALDRLYREAAFLVHPTLCYENSPNSVLEAMAWGKAIVTSDIGSMGELVEHEVNGLRVPPGDPEALASALATLWEDLSRREAMGRASRARVEARHRPAEHYRQLIDLFARLTGGSR